MTNNDKRVWKMCVHCTLVNDGCFNSCSMDPLRRSFPSRSITASASTLHTKPFCINESRRSRFFRLIVVQVVPR
jgi:hypothetical protein